MLRIPIQPGFVAAIFFIIVDIVSIALVDYVLCRLSNVGYYVQIYNAKPIRVKSVDIPGVTTYLLHYFLSPLNVVILLFKLAIIALVFFVNLNIDSEVTASSYQTTRTSTYDFDPSDRNLINELDRNVSRRPRDIATCAKVDPSNPDVVVFYRLAFDVYRSPTYDDILDETAYEYDVNDSTLLCMSPDFVPDGSVMPLVTVVGCSNLTRPNDTQGECSFWQPVERFFNSTDVYVLEGSEGTISGYLANSKVEMEYFRLSDESVGFLWPEYYPAIVHCVLLDMGPNIRENLFNRYRTCMVVSQKSGQTLVELWKLSFLSETSGKFTRNYAGPIFDRPVNVSVVAAINEMVRPKDIAWDTLGKSIVSVSALYQERYLNFSVYEQERIVTIVPTWAVIAGAVLFVMSNIAVIFVNVRFRDDTRPRLNTIDGLSSIAREEALPSKSSLKAGAPVLLGLSKVGGSVRLGPILTRRQAVSRQAFNDEVS